MADFGSQKVQCFHRHFHGCSPTVGASSTSSRNVPFQLATLEGGRAKPDRPPTRLPAPTGEKMRTSLAALYRCLPDGLAWCMLAHANEHKNSPRGRNSLLKTVLMICVQLEPCVINHYSQIDDSNFRDFRDFRFRAAFARPAWA